MSGGTATYQLQVIDGSYTKCVTVELVQVGSNIDAEALSAYYVSGSTLGYASRGSHSK